MNIREDIRPISYIKANAADILKQVNETHRPIYVTQNGEAKAVLIDTESYEKMNNSIGLLKILSQSEEDIKNNNYQNQKDFFASIEKKLEKMENNGK